MDGLDRARVAPDAAEHSDMVASGRLDDGMAGEFKSLGRDEPGDKPFSEVQLADALKNLLAPK